MVLSFTEPRRDQLLQLLLGTGQSWMDSQSDGVVDAADVVDLAPAAAMRKEPYP